MISIQFHSRPARTGNVRPHRLAAPRRSASPAQIHPPLSPLLRHAALTFAIYLTAAIPVPAQSLEPSPPSFAPTPSPEQDDATLHDVDFAGPQFGIAVGDRGTTWRTIDGGQHWEFRPVGFDVVLHSVSLLNQQLAWAAGTRIEPETRIASGVVLQSTDAGRTWRRLDNGLLPALTSIQFFSPLQGIAVGHGDARRPSGIYVTDDGGINWDFAPGPRTSGWTAAAFTSPKDGIVIGRLGQQGTFGNGRLLPLRAARSLRTWNDIALKDQGPGWLVGGGGAIRKSDDGGLSWPEPPTLLPPDIAELHDLHAVASVQTNVWVAGSPGSIIWHSPDAGESWRPQPTGDPTPIKALHFTTPLQGCAVGCFGQIRLTRDGGHTWQTVRGDHRRPALLAVQGDATQTPLQLITRESGEAGYRSVALTLTRRDFRTDQAAHAHALTELRAQVLAAGGNDALLDWRLPIRSPDLDRLSDQLVDDWSRLHEQRLRDVLLGGLVASLRTWRPDVVVCDQGEPGDAVAQLIRSALPQAIEDAADPLSFPEQQQLGLAPWTVAKTFLRTPAGAPGTLAVDPFQLLPRLGTTLRQAAARAAACGPVTIDASVHREAFRLTALSPQLAQTTSGDPAISPLARSLFSGLALPQGGEARRALPPLTEFNDEKLLALARHQRNFAAYADQMLDDPLRSGQLIAQLRQTVAPLPRDEAARLLLDLADDYRRNGQWDYVEQTLVQLVEQDPARPEARAALRWLLTRWTSQEVLWQKLRQIQATAPTETLNRAVLQANFEQAVNAVQQAENSLQAETQVNALPSPREIEHRSGIVQVGGLESLLTASHPGLRGLPASGTTQWEQEIARRRLQARRALALLKHVDPSLAAQPDIQFIVAALHRAQLQPAPAAEIYHSYFGLEDGVDPWNLTARGEVWITARGALSPKPVLRCARVAAPPLLDGELVDPCWTAAGEVPLRSTPDFADSNDPTFVGSSRLGATSRPRTLEAHAVAMLAYDDRYLYLAASVPRSERVPTATVQRAGRTYDQDLTGHDRIRFAFDLDRDYATSYQFEIDQRGATRESLWDDPHWNPKYHVATSSVHGHWRLEVAIPWEQLTPTPPQRGTVWAADITRLIPAVGLQSWTHPSGEALRPETFGLILFD